MSDDGEDYADEESIDSDENKEIDVDDDELKNIDNQIELDDDDDEEEDEDKVKKIEDKFKQKVISKHELHNTETVNIIPNDKRITRPIVVSGELSAILAYRTANIERGSPYYLPKDMITPTNPIDIARAEFNHRLCPLLIMRSIGKDIELWDPNTMIHPRLDLLSASKH